MLNLDQIPEAVRPLLADYWGGERKELTESDRELLLVECKKRGIAVQQYDFSNICVEGVSREDAAEWLLEKSHRKAFDLLRWEFGSTARFQTERPFIDFYWRKARLAVLISGALVNFSDVFEKFMAPRSVLESYQLKRDAHSSWLPLGRSMGELSGIPKTGIEEIWVPYYKIWHNPRNFLAEIRAKLVASRAYPRLTASPSAQV
jgi:hypothetical protein